MDLKGICVNMRNWIGLVQEKNYWKTTLNSSLNFWVSLARY